MTAEEANGLIADLNAMGVDAWPEIDAVETGSEDSMTEVHVMAGDLSSARVIYDRFRSGERVSAEDIHERRIKGILVLVGGTLAFAMLGPVIRFFVRLLMKDANGQ